MSYASEEVRQSGSQPRELFLFEAVGKSFAFTSGDTTIVYLGSVYDPETIDRTEVDQSAEVTSGEIKIYLPKANPLAQLFVPYLPTSPMSVTVFGQHLGDADTFVIFQGYVASARFTDQCELSCKPDATKLQQNIPQQFYQSACNHIFGDAGCKKDLSTVTYPGVISAISPDGLTLTVPGFTSLPHSLLGGVLRRGDDYRMIVSHVGAVIKLLSGIAGLAVSDSVLGTAGCQNTFASCSEHNNVANFLGFDLIPILDPFNGSVT